MGDAPTDMPLLQALTPEACRALGGRSEAALDVFPFRVGRESRTGAEPVPAEILERRTGQIKPTNDLYLLDEAFVKFISREHFQIERDEEGFLLRDCGSVCGVVVADEWVGAERKGGVSRLRDGDRLRVGGPDAPYEFRFVAAATPSRG